VSLRFQKFVLEPLDNDLQLGDPKDCRLDDRLLSDRLVGPVVELLGVGLVQRSDSPRSGGPQIETLKHTAFGYRRRFAGLSPPISGVSAGFCMQKCLILLGSESRFRGAWGSRVREAKKKARERTALRLQRIEAAAKAILDDVRRRHPGEELYCPYMQALGEAIKS
jgi:hypothetical protein